MSVQNLLERSCREGGGETLKDTSDSAHATLNPKFDSRIDLDPLITTPRHYIDFGPARAAATSGPRAPVHDLPYANEWRRCAQERIPDTLERDEVGRVFGREGGRRELTLAVL